MTTMIQPNPELLGQEYDPSSETWTPDYHPGAIAWDAHAKAYCWVRAKGAVKQHDFCVIDPSNFDAQATVAAVSIRNHWGGVAPRAVPAGRWFWLQRFGQARVKISGADSATNSQVRTNGNLTDADAAGRVTTRNATGNDFVVGLGIYGTASATTGAEEARALIDCMLNWPTVNG